MGFSIISSVFKKRHQTPSEQKKAEDQQVSLLNEDVDGRYFQDADYILKQVNNTFLVEQIKEVAGLSDESFNLYYLPVINNVAILCQDLGASERHHHAYPFGLVEHSLEVALYAMRRSVGCVYHPDRQVESIQWLERVFMYSVFCSGILHDAAKAITNHQWSILTQSGDWVFWSPIINSVPSQAERIQFKTESLKNRDGRNVFHQQSHEIFASHLLMEMMPQEGLEWIIQFSNDYASELFIHFIHTVASDYERGSDIALCVKLADSVSTDDSLKRANTLRSSNDYVDITDPNLPLFESYRHLFGQIFDDPESQFHLIVNKVAMGKFSHIERFGDLIFVSAKSVLPIVNKRLKEKGIGHPGDQAVFSLLVDNGITVPAPSGDTLWWAEFFSMNNNNKSKEMSYIVFDAANYATSIDDVRQFGVDIKISKKSLNGCEIKDTLFETLSDFPIIQEKLFGIPEAKGSTDASSDTTVSDRSSTTTHFAGDHTTHPLPENSSSEPSQISSDLVQESMECSELPLVSGPKELNAVTPPVTNQTEIGVQNRTELQSSISLDSQNTNTGDKKIKPETPIRQDRQHVGADKYEQKESPKKLTAIGLPNPQGKNSEKSTTPDLVNVAINQVLGGQITVADRKPRKRNSTSKSQEVCDIKQPNVTPNAQSKVFSECLINDEPKAIKLDEVELNNLLSATFPSELKLYEDAQSLQTSEDLFQVWIPYLQALVEKQVITCNEHGSAVLMLKDGLFISKHALQRVLAQPLVDRMFNCLSKSSHTFLNTQGTEIQQVSAFGAQFEGVLLATRAFSVQGKRIRGALSARLL